MRLGPHQDNPVTGGFIPVHENAAEMEASVIAIRDVIDVQAHFEFPEQKAFVRKHLDALCGSLYCLHIDGELPEVLKALSKPAPPDVPPEE